MSEEIPETNITPNGEDIPADQGEVSNEWLENLRIECERSLQETQKLLELERIGRIRMREEHYQNG